nr:TlpA disulfide reductase family protein [Micromonospora sp. HM5-17]
MSRRPAYGRRTDRRPGRLLLLGGALVAALLLTTGCPGADPPAPGSAAATEDGPTTGFADCTTLTAPPTTRSSGPDGSPGPERRITPDGSVAPPAGGTTASENARPATGGDGPGGGATPPTTVGSTGPTEVTPVRSLPTLSLRCLVGDTEIQVGALRGPAVINLWASWCPPCRKELPAFQRLFARANGAVGVIGVNTRDDRAAARSIGEDLGLRFPSLFDPDQRLLRHAARPLLPVTFFVDAQGRIRHQDQTGALDDAKLARLVREHLGVTVPS